MPSNNLILSCLHDNIKGKVVGNLENAIKLTDVNLISN